MGDLRHSEGGELPLTSGYGALRGELARCSPIRSCSAADHIARRTCRDLLRALRQGNTGSEDSSSCC